MPSRADEESYGRTAVPNPYQGPGPELTTAARMVDRLKRVLYMGVSYYILSRAGFFEALLDSPNVRHEWFKVGLAGTIAILAIKAYVEMYEGRMRKTKVDYKNFKHSTHAAIVLILLTTLSFNVALWPHFGWNSPVLLGVCFFGMIVQFLVIVPTSVSNIVAFVGLTYFLQEYR